MPDLIRLEYRDVTMRFAQRAGHLTAVQGVSIAVRDGEKTREREIQEKV